jgi:TM2 domain-containing membrane protein YozV
MSEKRGFFGDHKANYIVCPLCPGCRYFKEESSNYPYSCYPKSGNNAFNEAYHTAESGELPGQICPTITSCKAFEAKAGGSDSGGSSGQSCSDEDEEEEESSDDESPSLDDTIVINALGQTEATFEAGIIRPNYAMGTEREEKILDVIRESREAFRQSLQAEEDCVAGVTGIKGAGVALRDVPEHFKTPRVCLAAVTNYGGALEYVPENLKTPEICQAAVSNYGRALKDVPENLKTPEICQAAVSSSDGWSLEYVLKYVPENFKTPEFYMAAVSKNGEALRYVPENLKTPEICRAAVIQDGSALEYVPENFKTPEFCMAAVSKKGKALEYVPENLKTPEICRAAVIQDGSALEYVPVKMKKMLVYLKSPPPTIGKSYALLILTGFIGGHRFYLKKFKTGILFFLLFAAGISGYPLTFIPLTVWLIIDCITLGRQIKKLQERYK